MAEKSEKEKTGGWKSNVQGLLKFLWNSETKQFCGRGAKSWGQILLYYLIFYACLAGFFAINLSLFFTTIDDTQPRLQGYATLLKGHPGMGFRPALDGSTLIQIIPDDHKTYDEEVSALNDFLAPYHNQTGPQYVDCTNGPAPSGKVCRFDLGQFGPCSADNDYGYKDGKPCVLLKLNKIYGWVPDPNIKLDENGCNSAYYNATRHQYCRPNSNSSISITCEGEVAADIDNMGPISLYPADGLSYNYYPYLNQDGYLAPLVMVQFEHPKPGALLMIWCKAWAGNIYHDRNDQAGSVHFELEVDSGLSHH